VCVQSEPGGIPRRVQEHERNDIAATAVMVLVQRRCWSELDDARTLVVGALPATAAPAGRSLDVDEYFRIAFAVSAQL